jgi:hypothetical protein
MKKCLSLMLLITGALLLNTGCATTKIDWGARVGSYTFDMAVTDFGPPDKQAKLSDGSMVADWLTRRGYTTVSPAFYYGRCNSVLCGPPIPPMLESRTPDAFLRLTFDSDNRLASWKKFTR